ncbi:MAG: hypothetical protein PHP45_01020 [Elusimicrobiales bacterium]|nr:hypothetical protein [Elusimicrobiales bacterium]
MKRVSMLACAVAGLLFCASPKAMSAFNIVCHTTSDDTVYVAVTINNDGGFGGARATRGSQTGAEIKLATEPVAYWPVRDCRVLQPTGKPVQFYLRLAFTKTVESILEPLVLNVVGDKGFLSLRTPELTLESVPVVCTSM